MLNQEFKPISTPEAMAATRHQDLITAMLLRANELYDVSNNALAAQVADVAQLLQRHLDAGGK